MNGLDQRIAAALTDGDMTASDIQVLVDEVIEAIAAVDEERERAMDPLVVLDANEARMLIERVDFAHDRLSNALPQLEQRLAEVRAAERLAKWEAEYDQVACERDALAVELRQVYPEAVAKIIDVLTRLAAFNDKLSNLHQRRPAGLAQHLLDPELVARGLKGFSRDTPSITRDLQLPDWNQSSKLAWPPPQTPLAVLVAQSMMSALPHLGADWVAGEPSAGRSTCDE